MLSTTEHAARPNSLKTEVAAGLGHLLTRSASGDTTAFDALYSATSPRAHGLALRIIRDTARAEDITQEAYLKIWRTAAQFDPNLSSGTSWVLMIVHRVAVDYVRTAQARYYREDRHHRETAPLNSGLDDPTLELAHASLEAIQARQAFACLTRIQRQALELAYFEGHTYAEVATITGVPLGTAKARIRDGLIRLRTALDPSPRDTSTLDTSPVGGQ